MAWKRDIADLGAQMTRIWVELVKQSVPRPRAAARRLMALRIGPVDLVRLAVLLACLGALLAFLMVKLGAIPVSPAILRAPLLGALLELLVMAVIAGLTYRIGALFGGTGKFWDAVACVVWLNAMLLLLQVAQLVALVTVPPLAAVLTLFAVLWALWAYANFVTELHGFQNPYMVLGGVILTAIVVFIALAMLFAMLGISPREVG